ncbi:hypothetical protein [Gelidibacter gilvus]|uniref:Uncharacterized protein n=1 Tax=Gelidibacter gilvus TaxID=59602 RepID=A0A4Q0XCW0_9FLAO|nr:hypothetical protein [Gelidibacter gilvus]RXJ45781.1 hypothetical protein ESZ48_14455 [Gelidibacter gilvus]
MNKLTKFRILSFSAFIIIFLIISTLMNLFFEDLGGAYKAMISGGLTALLAPRTEKLKTQSGIQRQLVWVFLKKPISI